jgi:alpha 1,3-glucosidase
VFLFSGQSPKDILNRYSRVTGTAALPPYFSIAYHQCRWNYNDEEDVFTVNEKFDEHDIPYDVLWLDIEHTIKKRYFTWDPVKFPNPINMQKKLSEVSRKVCH